MNAQPTYIPRRAPQIAALIALAVLALLPGPARPATVTPPASVNSRIPQQSQKTAAPIVFASWWQESTAAVWSGLASRRAMMRFGAIIFVVALAAIWWRKT